MKPSLVLLGGWYVDALPTGEVAALMPGKIVRTHLGDLTPPPGETPLYTCITRTPTFQIAGQAWEVPGTSTFHDGTWQLDPRIAHGNFGCIFDRAGTLQIIEPAANQTSQGYRYVHDDGTSAGHLVLGDETLLKNGVSAFTDLSAEQDGSFLVGQGHDDGGVVVWLDGALRLLQAGECYAVRAYLDSDRVTIAFYDVQPDGLSAYVHHCTVDELRALPAIGAAPAQQPPKIAVESYDALMKAGAPWLLDFTNRGDGTRFQVTKDAQDRLWIEASNPAGQDQTGSVRQLTVEGPSPTTPNPEPQPEPEPPPMHTDSRFWCHPNIGSKDLLALFDDPARLAEVDVFGLYVQAILTDTPNAQLGPNVYPALVEHDVFRKLATAGVPLSLELGVVKGGDCDGKSNLQGMQAALQRVHDAGGVVGYLAMDEPLTASQQHCGANQDACADAVATFIHSVAALDESIQVAWIEAWPEVSYDHMAAFLVKLDTRDALPKCWHLDIDWNRAKKEKQDPARFLRDCQALAESYGIALGVMVNSTVDPIADDATHAANLAALTTKLHGILPDAAHVIVQSWATRTGGTQDVPNNLGASGLLASCANTRGVFETTPAPEPPPLEENTMLSTFTDPLKEVIAVKAIKPIPGSTAVTWILPNDNVYSCQPGGGYGERPAGTEGPWEKNRTAGNMGTFLVDGKYYTKAFVVVDGL